jgi:type IV pilus assembly protein PilN
MVKINLLPHREHLRRKRLAHFYSILGLCAGFAFLIVILVGLFIGQAVSAQNSTNQFIEVENNKLDQQIQRISVLSKEIASLGVRKDAVESLQSDRNQSVNILNELARQTPEGVYLRSLKQDARRLTLVGFAQSNERVSEYLRNLGNSLWFVRPELGETRSAMVGQGKETRRVYEFSIKVDVATVKNASVADQQANLLVTSPKK